MGIARAWTGDFEGAASLIAETDAVTAATGSSFPPYAALMNWGLRGREPEASVAISSAIEQSEMPARSVATHAHGLPRSCSMGLAGIRRRRRRLAKP